MGHDSSVSDIAHVIQLSIAPVFLLTTIATTLAVLSARLARIVDRARVLQVRHPTEAPDAQAQMRVELRALAKRRKLVNMAITSLVSAAVLVCLLIATAFVGSVLHANVSTGVALLFVIAMVAIMSAFVLFLREIFLAVSSVEIG